MKYLLLVAIVVGVIWLMRALRRPTQPPRTEAPPDRPASLQKEDMVRCDQCGVHLPRSESLPGRGGVFCSESHRAVFEKQRSG